MSDPVTPAPAAATPASPAPPVAPAPATPPAAATPAVVPPPAPAAAPAITPTEPYDEARAMQTIAAQRAEETRLKTENAALREAKARLDELEAAQLTDAQRLQKERDDAVAANLAGTTALREGRLLAELAKPEHRLVDATAAAKLIEGVTYDDAGNPTNLAERLTALTTARTFLVAPETTTTPPVVPAINPGGGATPAAGPTLTVEEAEAAQAAGMSPTYFAQLKELRDAPNQYETWLANHRASKAAAPQ